MMMILFWCCKYSGRSRHYDITLAVHSVATSLRANLKAEEEKQRYISTRARYVCETASKDRLTRNSTGKIPERLLQQAKDLETRVEKKVTGERECEQAQRVSRKYGFLHLTV